MMVSKRPEYDAASTVTPDLIRGPAFCTEKSGMPGQARQGYALPPPLPGEEFWEATISSRCLISPKVLKLDY